MNARFARFTGNLAFLHPDLYPLRKILPKNNQLLDLLAIGRGPCHQIRIAADLCRLIGFDRHPFGPLNTPEHEHFFGRIEGYFNQNIVYVVTATGRLVLFLKDPIQSGWICQNAPDQCRIHLLIRQNPKFQISGGYQLPFEQCHFRLRNPRNLDLNPLRTRLSNTHLPDTGRIESLPDRVHHVLHEIVIFSGGKDFILFLLVDLILQNGTSSEIDTEVRLTDHQYE